MQQRVPVFLGESIDLKRGHKSDAAFPVEHQRCYAVKADGRVSLLGRSLTQSLSFFWSRLITSATETLFADWAVEPA